MQLEFALLKQDSTDDSTADDGFLDAMNTVAADVWSDGE